MIRHGGSVPYPMVQLFDQGPLSATITVGELESGGGPWGRTGPARGFAILAGKEADHGGLHCIFQRRVGALQPGQDRSHGPGVHCGRRNLRRGSHLQREELSHGAAHRPALPLTEVRPHRPRTLPARDVRYQRGGDCPQRTFARGGGGFHHNSVHHPRSGKLVSRRRASRSLREDIGGGVRTLRQAVQRRGPTASLLAPGAIRSMRSTPKSSTTAA